MNIAIIGTGYVGLVAGACFAESGNDVLCVDINENKIALLNQGHIPIYEPGLEELIKANRESGRINFTTDIKKSVQASEVIFIAVGTPEDKDGSADLKHVLAVAKSIGESINNYKIIVNKSTVPVGTASLVSAEIAKHTSIPFDVVSNPEFLKEGSAIDDFMRPDRVVIGSSSEKAREIMTELYSPFVRTGNPILTMDVQSAEVTKYAANALLATKVSFMNEISNLCQAVGADVNNVRIGIGTDSRIGQSFLFPGVGYGGSCFPKDIRALVKTGEENNLNMEIVSAVDRVNTRQKEVIVKMIEKHFGGRENLRGKKIALWGLAFKPKTDDCREAPSLTIIRMLSEMGVEISAYDPEAMEVAKGIFQSEIQNGSIRLNFVEGPYEVLKGADALVIVTEWNEFRRPNFQRMKEQLKAPLIFDGRNLFKPESISKLGFSYYSIGRVPVQGEV